MISVDVLGVAARGYDSTPPKKTFIKTKKHQVFLGSAVWYGASYQRCGEVLSTWVKLPYFSEKQLIYINYCTNCIHSLLQRLHS